MATNPYELPASDAARQMLGGLLDPVGRCLSPDVARQIVNLRADESVQSRLEALAEKSTEGELTPSEREEYEAGVRAVEFIGVLQAKARALLNS